MWRRRHFPLHLPKVHILVWHPSHLYAYYYSAYQDFFNQRPASPLHIRLPFLTTPSPRISILKCSYHRVFLTQPSLVCNHHSAMATTEVEAPPTNTPDLPDYLLDPNAVLKDNTANWRYGRAPDYSNTRKVYTQSKFKRHLCSHIFWIRWNGSSLVFYRITRESR